MVETKTQSPKLPRWDASLFKTRTIPTVSRSALSIKAERQENSRLTRKTFTLFDMGSKKRKKIR